MSNTTVIALPYFRKQGEEIAEKTDGEFCEYSETVFEDTFKAGRRIIALMSTGIVIRKIAPLLRDKWSDPPVVVVSPDMKYAIPLSGGHHGANDLAYELEGKMGITPVITTATEALGKESVEVFAGRHSLTIVNKDSTRLSNAAILTKTAGIWSVEGPGMLIAGKGVSILVADGTYACGIGCRRDITPDEVISSIQKACTECKINPDDIFIYATSTLKSHEPGLIEAIQNIRGNLVYLDHDELSAQVVAGESAAVRFGIPGVAEPAALAVSRRKELVMEKKVYGNVTIAIAR